MAMCEDGILMRGKRLGDGRLPLRSGKVARSTHRMEIETKLRYGESPLAVSRWLAERREKISPRTLRDFRKKRIAPQLLLQASDYAPAHAHLNQRVNALNELYNAIVVQQNRLCLGLKQEMETKTLSSVTSANMKILFDLLTSTLDAEISLGLRMKQTSSNNDDFLRRLIDGVLHKTDGTT